MNTISLSLVAVLMLAAYSHALECYHCTSHTIDDLSAYTYADGSGNGKDCSKEDPKTEDMTRVINDNDDVCYACQKSYFTSGDVTVVSRSCINKDTFDAISGAKIDDCAKVDMGEYEMEYCHCDGKRCNGSGRVLVSIATIVMAAVAKVIL